MELAFALLAALLFALGTVLQQKAGLEDAPERASSGLLLHMARRPVWVAGIVTDGVGFLAQAAALTIGRLAVVQPVLVSSVVFALPLGARLTKQRVRRLDIAAAIALTLALGVFLLVADPRGGRDNAPLAQWAIALTVSIALAGALVVAARGTRPATKAALLGSATGVGFALCAALTKAVGDQLTHSPLGIFTHGELYALGAIGYASMTVSQLSLQTGKLAPAIATAMAVDPVVSAVLGLTLLQERLHTSTAGLVLALLALAVAMGGLIVLARREEAPAAAD
jgi:drug/metabolite transporter (DMT)-like permease